MGLTCSRISACGLGEAPTFSTVVSAEAASEEAAEEAAEEAVLEPQAARLAARASASTDATIFFMLCHSSFINGFAWGPQ